MRLLGLAIVLTGILAAQPPAAGFEIEDQRMFGLAEANSELRIISTVDLDLFTPLVLAFQKLNPDMRIEYTVASSAELFKAINDENTGFDLAISSAMDLQTKLANDGLAQEYQSSLTDSLPDWARWSDVLFAFTQEPAVVIASRSRLEGMALPVNRRELIQFLRDNPDIFQDKVGTYDPRISGLGYLFATQDTRQSEDFWRLAEVTGTLGVSVYCCSGAMINAIEAGEITLAYNVLGSYAAQRIGPDSDAVILPMQDYTHVMLRTALIPKQARNPEAGGDFIDFLLSPVGRELIRVEAGLPPIDAAAFASEQSQRPIRLGPGLLVYLDRIKRANFLSVWSAAVFRK
ncbi:MAG: ABC transporter substrate-binding protein [Boseongicola sp.]